LIAALALAAAPTGDAFVVPSSAAALRAPALRTGTLAALPVASRSARARTVVTPRMSDMSDMALEMLKRVEKTLPELDDIALARVRDPALHTVL